MCFPRLRGGGVEEEWKAYIAARPQSFIASDRGGGGRGLEDFGKFTVVQFVEIYYRFNK